MLTAFTGGSSERCPGIGFLSRGDREIGVLRNVEPPTRPRLECLRETGLILRCDRKVGNPFQTKQGSRPSCPDQEGRKGSEEGVPENLSVPLEGDRDFGELCGSHQGCQVPFRPPIPNVGLLLRRCSGKGLHMTGYRKTENDKQVAEAKAAAEAKARDEVEANKNAMAAQKEATAKMLSDMEQQLAAFDISLREKELEAGANKTQVELENLKAYNAEAIKLEQARYEKGLITKQEFLNKSAEMDLAVREAEAEIQLQQDEMNNERLAMDAQNRFDLKMIQTENEYEQRQIALDAAYEQEIAAAERVGADTTLITQKYAAAKAQVEKAQMNAKLSIASETAGQLSDLLGEESKAGKAFAVVQATINTYLGATKALASGGLAGIAQAAVVIAFGLKQVATIVKQKDPDTKVNSSTKKFAKGGQIYGASHAQGGVTFRGSNGQTFEAEGGENVYIMKRTASAEINALSSLNVSKGGRSFSTSGLYKFAEGGQVASISSYNAGSVMAGDVRLSKTTMQQLAEVVIGAVSAMPNPVVTVQDINGGQADVRVLQNSATF